MGPQDTPYESGIYKAKLLFPPEFPSQPPEMIFQTENRAVSLARVVDKEQATAARSTARRRAAQLL